MARPTKLSPEIQKKILDLVAEGNYLATAALAAGVDPRTYRRWRQHGKAGKKPYAEFFQQAAIAEARGEAAMVALLKFSALGHRKVRDPKTNEVTVEKFEGDPKPIQWLMQRRLGTRWGARVQLEVDNALGDMMRELRGNLDPDTFKRVVEALETREDRAASSDNDELASEFDDLDEAG